MAIKNRMWMTGQLEWVAYVGNEEMYLGKREVPIPLEEGDSWTNQYGFSFRIENGEIVIVERGQLPEQTDSW